MVIELTIAGMLIGWCLPELAAITGPAKTTAPVLINVMLTIAGGLIGHVAGTLL